MLRRTGLIVMLTAVLGAAHATPDPQAAASPATPGKARPSVATTAAATHKAGATVAKPATPKVAGAPTRATAAVAKPSAKKSKPAAAKAASPAVPAPEMAKQPEPVRVKRDPFVSIVQERIQATSSCVSGKKCLAPNEIVLKGVVKGPNGMIALVETQRRKAYFLRENDPVLNGEVMRITSDSIIFRERVTDRVGRVSTREVIKHIPGSKPA